MRNQFKNLYLDIHMIQMLPPSNVNRGQMGEPKTALIGSTTRARISSQSQKRPARLDFMRRGYDIGIRTKFPAEEIKRRLIASGMAEDRAAELAKTAVTVSQIASSKEDAKGTLVYLSGAQFDAMCEVLRAYDREPAEEAPKKGKEKGKEKGKKENDPRAAKLKKDLVAAIRENPSIDQLLFGRMFADNASLNYDAAAQVMHGFSVNKVKYEFDYFSAVDDLSKKLDPEHSGAGHISSKLFTDPVLYRYANVNLSETSELIRFDKENAADDAVAFAESFIMTLPTGASNSYASGTMPSYVLLILRDDRPINFAPAFIEAVKSDNYIAEAIEKLEKEKERIAGCFGAPVFSESSKDASLKDMLARVREEITGRI